MVYRLEVPKSAGAAAVREFIESWLEQPALRHIVELEGGAWPQGSLEKRVAALHDFSDRWDFRGGSERLEISSAGPDGSAESILSEAEKLGLTLATPPSRSSYDHALVLGGTALASIYRLRRLYELLDEGLQVEHIAILTALREVGEAELELVAGREDIAPIVVDRPRTEFEVMVAALEFFSGEEARIEWEAHENPHLESAKARCGNALALAAPSADPHRRANTRDNYDAYSRFIGPEDSVLIVTSSIYLPYQFFIGLQALGWNEPRTIEAVGFPPEWMEGVLTGATNVLQEVRSALFGAEMTLRGLED